MPAGGLMHDGGGAAGAVIGGLAAVPSLTLVGIKWLKKNSHAMDFLLPASMETG